MKALFLLIASGILSAGVFITGKQAGATQLSPLLILFWQMSGAAVTVTLIAWPSRRFPIWDCAHLRYYLIGGLLGVSLPYLLAFVVLQQLQIGIVGLLTALSPVVTYALARLFGLEQGHPLRLVGLVTGLGGVALLLAPQASLDFTGQWPFLLLALGIPVTLAASNIYRSHFWPTGSDAMPLVTGMLVVQGAWLFVVNLLLGNFNGDPVLDATGLTLAVLALFAGASYLTSFNLLRIGGPVYLSQIGYVITAVTLLAGIVVWGEHYDRRDILSMGFILAGVLLTTWTRSNDTPRDTAEPIEKENNHEPA